jgi:hypothetical protein
MREIPILFTGDMVRAIVEGRKIQTRRLVHADISASAAAGVDVLHRCPYGQAGDLLWVREAWAAPNEWDEIRPRDLPQTTPIYYRADGYRDWEIQPGGHLIGKWRPSIFLPRWASRISLRNARVRVERLQDIREIDALAEGVLMDDQCVLDVACYGGHPVEITGTRYFSGASDEPREFAEDAYRDIWDSINGNRVGCDWASNPFVWAISFRLETLIQ